MRLCYIILTAVAALAAATAVRAQCLIVRDNSLQEVNSRYGITTADWSGTVHNTCQEPYDAFLTIKFEDKLGHVLYKDVQVVIVQGGQDESTKRRIDIPADKYEKIENIDVAVDERQRPR